MCHQWHRPLGVELRKNRYLDQLLLKAPHRVALFLVHFKAERTVVSKFTDPWERNCGEAWYDSSEVVAGAHWNQFESTPEILGFRIASVVCKTVSNSLARISWHRWSRIFVMKLQLFRFRWPLRFVWTLGHIYHDRCVSLHNERIRRYCRNWLKEIST